MSAESSIKKVAIIGAGSIGCSWAALFIANGIETTVFDVNPSAESLLRSLVAGALPVLSRLGSTKNQTACASDILFTTDLATALKDADFVQENGPERLELKHTIFNDITKHIRPDTIISTSSSGLTCSSIQSGVKAHPERCVVGHPFNPPHLIPLAEVVGGSQTTSDVIDRTMRFYESLGKKAVHVKKEVAGHIANRLQSALFREVMHLIQNDVCSVSDIEDAMQHGPGLRWGVMGPSCLMHLAGGPGGIEHMSNHLLEPMMGWYAKQDPVVDDDLKKKWIEGTREAVDGRSYESLAKQRDEELIELLKIRKDWDGYAARKKSE
ncbi:3-hydroxyacyl-CoA dehydrogenase [Saccharata proteae CBS 121410]|uniref:3-hydroxyacyl-CoA dehydrogenase n=1 Tax=Saccharata proteae CBS 121410 TaxID=1314787 RepID=A0A9P4LWI5_9PEZI|nr:3-hydroxyacyl-CoA dehydrogenase [Saccharata proteae CBS 121410]